ncbi:hypothetical protein [Nitrincola alkalisediminis]|uniref:hypothetical protein n=1 Tax=Nitrincola alkalisediminis TaxID=1366656 RepID=UPI0018737F85|nr:hypothetical protein [Nitrincola alkalisediminis]
MQNIKLDQSIKTVVHLGAGYCSELAFYQDSKIERIILVEGDTEIAQELRESYQTIPSVEVVEAVVDVDANTKPFFVFSLSELNSVRRATSLTEFFPSVRQLSSVEKNVQDINTLVQNLKISEGALLVVDLPGISLDVLTHLEVHDQLSVFTQVCVHANRSALYESESTADELKSWMEEQGFIIEAKDENTDFDRPVFVFQRSALFIKNKELQEVNTNLIKKVAEQSDLLCTERKEKADLSNKLNEEQEKFSTLLADHSALSKRKESLDDAVSQLTEQLSQLKSELDATTLKKNEEVDQLKKKIVDLESIHSSVSSALDDLKVEHGAQADLLSTEREQKADLANQLKEEQSKLAALFADNSVLSKQNESLDATVSQLTEQLSQVKSELDATTLKKNEEVDQLKKKIVDLESIHSSVLSALDDLKVEHAAQADLLSTEREQKADLTKQLKEEQSKLFALLADNSVLSKQNETLDAAASQLTEQLSQVKNELEKSALKNNEDVKQLKIQIENNHAQKNTEVEGLKKQISELLVDLDTKKLAIVGLEKNISDQVLVLQSEKKSKVELQETLKKIQADSEKKLSDQKEAYTKIKDELDKTKAKLDETHQYFINRRKQAEEGEVKIKELSVINASLQKELDHAKTLIENEATAKKNLDLLESKLVDLLTKQSEQINQNTNALGQHVTRMVTNSSKQIESFVGLQSYFANDGQPLVLQNTGLSSDLALYLTEKIHSTNFDCILQFGTGATTLLLAKALRKQKFQKSENHKLVVHDQLDMEKLDTLPRHIICFEHDKKQTSQLQTDLNNSSFHNLVDLNFSPLVDYRHKGEDFLFYDCKAKLQHLAHVFSQRTAKFLVLVEGPNTLDGCLSRYPVLTHLLKYLSAHQLQILIVDKDNSFNAETEKRWDELLEKRELVFSKKRLALTTNTLLLNINV